MHQRACMCVFLCIFPCVYRFAMLSYWDNIVREKNIPFQCDSSDESRLLLVETLSSVTDNCLATARTRCAKTVSAAMIRRAVPSDFRSSLPSPPSEVHSWAGIEGFVLPLANGTPYELLSSKSTRETVLSWENSNEIAEHLKSIGTSSLSCSYGGVGKRPGNGDGKSANF